MDTMDDPLDGLNLPEPARQQVKDLSHTHEQVINWLILNPHLKLRECADHFGYTQSWLSTLIHSDAFQAQLKSRQEQVFAQVAGSIPEKLAAAADVAIEKLSEKVEKSEDPEFILDAFDKILHRAGYAPASAKNPGGNTVNNTLNVFQVDKATLASARDNIKPRELSVQEAELLSETSASKGEDAIATPSPEII